jgi:outer membrane protein
VKGRQLEAEINRFKQDASNFQAQAQVMDKSGRKTWSWIAKREQELGYAQQALAQQLQQQGGVEMDSLVSGVKNSLNHTVKKKVILISMVLEMQLFYMPKTNMTLQSKLNIERQV